MYKQAKITLYMSSNKINCYKQSKLGQWHVLQSKFSYNKYIELRPLHESSIEIKMIIQCIHDGLNF